MHNPPLPALQRTAVALALCNALLLALDFVCVFCGSDLPAEWNVTG